MRKRKPKPTPAQPPNMVLRLRLMLAVVIVCHDALAHHNDTEGTEVALVLRRLVGDQLSVLIDELDPPKERA